MKKSRHIFSGLNLSLRRKIEQLISESPSPALAQAIFMRLLEASGPGSLNKIPKGYLPDLVRLLGSSATLSDLLIQKGRAWPALFLKQIKIPQKSTAKHLSELSHLSKRGVSFDQLACGLRQYKQLEILRIGTRDLSPSVPVDDTMRELTALAEATLETAYLSCRSDIEKDFGPLYLPGTKTKNGFVILGMGKLGGEELNFSSDIDLIYFFEEDEGESAGGRKGKIGPRDYFTRLAEQITRVMGEVTENGIVYRTDLRLRPLGRNGPIVQSLYSALLYYESWGQNWERAALIKARPVAGDKELGTRFLREAESFIYRRYLDFTTVEDLREMKLRIEQELLGPGKRERNLKLGPGGIREVEFFTQALQLVNGGYEPRVRCHNTLRALNLLARHGLIPEEEMTGLSHAYRFLRDGEHKVQMVQEAHTYSIPEGEEEERALARRLNYGGDTPENERELFWQDFHRHAACVRKSFEKLFFGAQREISPEGSSSSEKIWSDLDHEELVLEELKGLGFKDPPRAYHNLLAVRDGDPYSLPSPRRLKVMRALGPALMNEILRSGFPDQVLFNLVEFCHRVGGRTGFLSLLAENPKTMRLLIRLFSNSQFLTDLFLRRPELLDSLIRVDLTQLSKTGEELAGELTATLEYNDDMEDKLNSLRRFRAEEFIRIGLHDIGGELGLEDVIAQLSDLADACLEGALRLSFQEMDRSYGRMSGGRFAILGMGKLGGSEIDYNSDLDLIFIYDAPEESQSEGAASNHLEAQEYYVRLGQKLLTFLSAPLAEGIVYKIDMQLRPSGKAGPLVSSLESFRHYHQTSSQLWERQALIKARYIAGDRDLGGAAVAVAEGFAYSKGLTKDENAEINHLRMRMERELAKEDSSRFNLKKGKGGLVDIEFITQMLQLSHGHLHPSIRQRGILQALGTIRDNKIINQSDYHLLSEGYRFLRQLDHRMRLERDQSIDILEREAEKLQGIATAMGYKGRGKQGAGELLLRDYEKQRERIRSCYERFFESEVNRFNSE
ncbi:MAG: bifunctional [glutamate--ammonia ligase]-adenylyl-L-tyrosine phosphorylase/[glutamate--ammonia-ligase] adenylyltransferase [Candidatus Binatia bacterium]